MSLGCGRQKKRSLWVEGSWQKREWHGWGRVGEVVSTWSEALWTWVRKCGFYLNAHREL